MRKPLTEEMGVIPDAIKLYHPGADDSEAFAMVRAPRDGMGAPRWSSVPGDQLDRFIEDGAYLSLETGYMAEASNRFGFRKAGSQLLVRRSQVMGDAEYDDALQSVVITYARSGRLDKKAKKYDRVWIDHVPYQRALFQLAAQGMKLYRTREIQTHKTMHHQNPQKSADFI